MSKIAENTIVLLNRAWTSYTSVPIPIELVRLLIEVDKHIPLKNKRAQLNTLISGEMITRSLRTFAERLDRYGRAHLEDPSNSSRPLWGKESIFQSKLTQNENGVV